MDNEEADSESAMTALPTTFSVVRSQLSLIDVNHGSRTNDASIDVTRELTVDN